MSFWRVCYHLVWATKEREPLIKPEFEDKLFAYLVVRAYEQNVRVYAIGGWYDHVHLVASIPPKHAIADVVKQLKGASSHYLNHVIRLSYTFAWQRGYGVLSLGESQRPQAEGYVANQKTHHSQQTTNAWLERVAEFDEGPADVGILPDSMSSVLREQVVGYEVSAEFPF